MINLIVVISVVVFTILTYLRGSRILLASIISFYPASMVYAVLPAKEKMLFLGTDGVSLFYSHAAIFFVIFIILFYAVYKIISHAYLGHAIGKWLNAFLVGGSFVLLLVALSFHILPAYNIFQITNSDIRSFWLSDWGYLACIVAPLIAIFKVARK